MDDYAGRVLADRYRLPLPPSDEYEFAETRAFDTYSGQEVLVRQVPLPEVVDAEVLDEPAPGRGGARRPAGQHPRSSRTTRSPGDPAVRRAIEAAEAAARIPDHPRLDQVFDVFAEGGSLWIVSEVVAARPLAALLAERPLTPYRAAEVASDVLTALRALHAHGWVHRNITVRTVLVCDDGRVMLTGLAAGAAEEALCGYDPVPDAGGGFDGRAAAATASGAVPGEVPGRGRGAAAAVEGERAALPAAFRKGPGGAGDGGTEESGRTEEGGRAGQGGRVQQGGLPGAAESGPGGPGAGGMGTSGGAGAGGAVASGGAAARGALPAGDVRAARAGAIAAYRAGVRSAAAARALPPGGGDGAGVRRDGEALQGTPQSPGAPAPPGQIADPYGVAGRPAARRTEVRHLSAGPAARTGAAGSAAQSAVGWHGAGRRIPGQLPGAGAEGSQGEEARGPGDLSGSAGASGPAEGAGEPAEGSYPRRTPDGLPQYKDQILPAGHAAPAPAVREEHEASAPALREEYGTAAAAPYGTEAAPDEHGKPSRWDELAGVGQAAAQRSPATPLELERARQARMTVVGAVTERWAPEQAGPVHENWQLAAPVGPATDLWALGALLFRAVQGHAPYPEDSTYELVQLVCAEPPAFAEECGPLRPVVESLLRQDPTERPDFEELRGWLRSLVRSAPEPEAGANVVPAPAYDRTRLPVVRRRGELVRKRRGGRGQRDESGPPEHGRHKKGRAARRRRAPEQRRALAAETAQLTETAQLRAPERPGRERMSASAEKWERQQQRQMRQMSRRPQGGGGPKRLGRLLLVLILLGVAAAVAYAMLFMPKSGTDDQGAGDRKGQAGSASSAPAGPGDASPDGGGDGKADDGKPDKEPEKKPSEDASKEPPRQTEAPPAGELPQGFVLRKDLEGFQVAVASGWDRKPVNGRGQVVYGQGDFSLTVVPGRDSTRDYGTDPLKYQREDERELQPFRDSTWAGSGGLRQVEVGGQVRAEGQFTWEENGRKLFVRNAAILLDGAYHVVLVKGPESERDEVTRLFEQAVATYEKTG
ncbi:protein kinase [Streptomyces indicus]|uniref:Protein kinase domain-containing protein n=1 Tax=Streptomyces indicus TaxID=417292 RepID=A0A1G9ED84_9ACTN|nr:protein kinase [Streptomyces indicus]SDK74054.1 Protein kinase domain-containing protein [Streptomyces indicus]